MSSSRARADRSQIDTTPLGDVERTDPESPGLWAPPEELDFDLFEATGGRLVHRNEIGTGGVSRVLLAYDTALEREVAVKVFSAGKDNEAARQQFLREVRITAMLSHPGIVPVYDLGSAPGGRHFFTMPVLEGTTLREQLARGRSAAADRDVLVSRWLVLVVRVCEAMAYAHDQGVLHLDLKPTNIMLGTHGEVMVLDWGAAKRLDELPSAEQQGPRKSMAGTPGFMAPEQIAGDLHLLSPATDVFALGVILYEVLTGDKPEPGPHGRPLPVAVAARRNEVNRVPPELAAICEKCLARRVGERYANAAELAEDLRNYQEHRSVSAFRAGPVLRARRWCRRHRSLSAVLLTLSAIGLLLGVLALAAALRHRTFVAILDESVRADRKEYEQAARQSQWTRSRLARTHISEGEGANLAEELRRDELSRYLTGQALQTSLSSLLAARGGRHSPELARELRKLWLEGVRMLRQQGDVDAVRDAYKRMLELQRTVPWWRWEPDEFPELQELRRWLIDHGGIPRPESDGTH